MPSFVVFLIIAVFLLPFKAAAQKEGIQVKPSPPSPVLLKDAGKTFCLPATLDGGQAFRWRERPDGQWEGVAGGRYARLEQQGDDIFLFCAEEDLSFWREYFDLERDYAALWRKFSRNPTLRRALDRCPGVRVLRQRPWETLCTFILSANNNIPRIKGIVERLCGGWGGAVDGTELRAFPAPERLAALSAEDLAPLRAGWRTEYILDAARMVAEGRLDLEEIVALPTDQALERLQTVKGVGPKVARCVLLFGYGRAECVPMDVWMKRVMVEYYPQGFPKYLRDCGGIAQQVLFSYIRTREEGHSPPP